MANYHQKIIFLQRLQLIMVILCVIGIVVFAYFFMKPNITGYAVKDECGPIGGSISHSINDKDSCANACNAFCQSLNKEYHTSNFVPSDTQCNSCECRCKDERFKR